MQVYNQETEGLMQFYYSHLSEKDKRHYAALEARKLGYGGKRYIGQLLKISQKTIRKAEAELIHVELYAQIPEGKQRRAGGGRKKFCP
jgi:hypothetical protein